MPSMLKDRTLAFCVAVPKILIPSIDLISCVAVLRRRSSCLAMSEMPMLLIQSKAADRAMAPSMFGVPASNLNGSSL